MYKYYNSGIGQIVGFIWGMPSDDMKVLRPAIGRSLLRALPHLDGIGSLWDAPRRAES